MFTSQSRIILKVLVITVCLFLTAQGKEAVIPDHNWRENGYVPTEEVAVAIALAVSKPVYGEEIQKEQLPFKAVLTEKGTWVVTGTLHGMEKGGTIIVEIDKKTGAIVCISHGK